MDIDGETLNVSFNNLLQSSDVDPRATQSDVGAISTQATIPFEPWWRGQWHWRRWVLRPRRASVGERLAARRGSKPMSSQEQTQLIQRVTRLDDMHALGEVSDTEWNSQRAMLKRVSWILMKD